MSEPQFTPVQLCSHCGNRVSMEIVATHSPAEKREDEPKEFSWCNQRLVYELLSCPTCQSVSLRSYSSRGPLTEPSNFEFKRLYPDRRDDRLHIAKSIENTRFGMGSKFGAAICKRLQVIHECKQRSILKSLSSFMLDFFHV